MSVAIEIDISLFIVGIVVLLCLVVCVDECKIVDCIQDDAVDSPPTDLVIDLSSVYTQPHLVIHPIFYDSFVDISDNPHSVV